MHDGDDRQSTAREPRLLIVETSHRVGLVAVALGDRLVGERRLDEARRHARDLAPAIRGLLLEQGWRVRDLDAVVVSRGPGSYTGLRVGIMSAKMLAYATGCTLLAIDTFAAIHQPLAKEHPDVAVIADAQQDKIYVQRFGPAPEPLAIVPFDRWIQRNENSVVTGPGLESFAARLPVSIRILANETWLPQPAGLLAVALRRIERGERDDIHAVEPLYLRASSAEEKWSTIPR